MKLLNFFRRTPEKPAERSTVRARHPALRGRSFAAGVASNLTHSWSMVPLSPDQIVYRQLRALRARARDQFNDNDYARRFVGMVQANVVGPEGMAYQARTLWTGSNGKQELDTQANEALESAWSDWSKAKYCHTAQRQSLVSLMRLALATVANDGEVFIHRRLGQQYGKYQYALKLIDAERLDIAHNQDLKNGNVIRFGIELDSDERAVAYYFKDSAADLYGAQQLQQQYVRVPAEEIFHLYLVERVGQKRGIPWLATSLQAMKMLDGYAEAALVAARVGASKAVFYKQDEDADPNAMGIGELDASGELNEDIDPGSGNILPPGVNIESYDPTYPHSDYGSFHNAQLRRIATGAGVSAFKLGNDPGDVNYSSAKVFELEEREVWKSLQSWMIESLLMPLYEDWLAWQLRLGTIVMQTGRGPRALSSDRFEKYTNIRFQPRRWEFNEPLKAAQAHQLNLNLQLTSPQRLMRAQGVDPADVVQEWQQWGEMLEAAGLSMSEPDAVAIESEETDEAEGSEESQAQNGDRLSSQDFKALADSYGVAVRAGAITPQVDDERFFRAQLGIPGETKPVEEAWQADGGVRRPVTLKSGEAFKAEQEQIAEDSDAENETDSE